MRLTIYIYIKYNELMITKEEILKNAKHEDEILELIYNHQDYTTSDLQGRVMAIVLKIKSEK